MRSAWRTVEKRCEIRIVVACRVACENAVENLRLAAHIQLRGGFVEQHQTGAQLHARTKPAPAQCAAIALRTDRFRPRIPWRAGYPDWRAAPRQLRASAARITSSGAPRRSNVVAQRQLEPDKVLKHSGQARCASFRYRTHADPRRQFRWHRFEDRTAGTAAWPGWFCPRRSGRRSRATIRREWSDRSHPAPVGCELG